MLLQPPTRVQTLRRQIPARNHHVGMIQHLNQNPVEMKYTWISALSSSAEKIESADGFDSPILAKPPGIELSDDELCNAFNYPRNLVEVFHPGPIIGSGSFGIVSIVTDRQTGVQYASKSIPKRPRTKPPTSAYLLKLQNEIDCMRQLGASLNAVNLRGAYEDDTHVQIVMELCDGGALLDRLGDATHNMPLTEGTVARVIRSVLQFLAQCHSKGIVYRDVKAGNFLFLNKTPSSPLKATDFGLAIRHDPSRDPPLTSRAGTPAYMAPEVITQEYDYRADLYSVGVLTFQLATGRFPFHPDITAVKLPEVFRATLTEEVDWTAEWVRDALSSEAADFIRKLMDKDPDTRMTSFDALRHPWILHHTHHTHHHGHGHEGDVNVGEPSGGVQGSSVGTTTLASSSGKGEGGGGGARSASPSVAASASSSAPVTPSLYSPASLASAGATVDEVDTQQLQVAQRLQRFATQGHLRQVACNLISAQLFGQEATFSNDPIARDAFGLMGKCKALFVQLDRDKSGTLERGEIINGMRSFGYHMSDQEIDALFHRVDANGDGKLQYEEFVAAFLDWDKLAATQFWDRCIDRALDALDADGSGYIELEELERLLHHMDHDPVARRQEARRMLREADLNRDGRISKLELTTMMKTHLVADVLENYDDRTD